MPIKYKIYGGKACKWCHKARFMLEDYELDFQYIDIDVEFSSRTEFFDKFKKISNNKRSIPFIFVDGEFLGGYTQLEKYIQENEDTYDDDF